MKAKLGGRGLGPEPIPATPAVTPERQQRIEKQQEEEGKESPQAGE